MDEVCYNTEQVEGQSDRLWEGGHVRQDVGCGHLKPEAQQTGEYQRALSKFEQILKVAE